MSTAPEMRDLKPLARPFAGRMVPLALLAGLVCGVVLPAVYQSLVIRERAGEARLWAQEVAARLGSLAQARPLLWSYDQVRLAQATERIVRPPISARIRVDVPDADKVFEAGSQSGDSVAGGWAIVRSEGRAIGRVRVELATSEALEGARLFWTVGGISGAMLAAALLFLPLLTVRRADQRNLDLWGALQEANAHLEERVRDRTEALRARQVQLADLGARLVAVQEEERARISRDLHDELGQTLTGLRLRLTMMEALLPADETASGGQREQIHSALEAVDDAVEQVRTLAHGLRPPALDALGLAAALSSHADRWAEAVGLDLTLNMEPIEPEAQIAEVLFRVGQEALTNIARHAHAERVRITLDGYDDGWRLMIEDDGVGLSDMDRPRTDKGGLGLVGARERVEQAGGYLDLEPSEWGGACLLAWLPEEM
ncbi:MAG: sensor histidine kinase [Bradymonadia bacterium]